MNADGTNVRKLTEEGGGIINEGPFSPDGKSIVFYKAIEIDKKWHSSIYVLNIETGKLKEIANIDGIQCEWSPDGKQIVFIQREYTWKPWQNLGIALIYHAHRYMICDRNGENIRQFRIPKDSVGYGIDWMDDGKSIVFRAREDMPLNEPIPRGFVFPPSNIYKYQIWTGRERD